MSLTSYRKKINLGGFGSWTGLRGERALAPKSLHPRREFFWRGFFCALRFSRAMFLYPSYCGCSSASFCCGRGDQTEVIMAESYSELSYFLKVDGGPSTESPIYPTLVKEFEITEGLSQLFEIHLVVEQEGGDVSITEIMRKEATLTLSSGGIAERHFHGIVIAVQELEEIDDRVPYRLHIAPRMWVMKHTRGSRVFQDMTVC